MTAPLIALVHVPRAGGTTLMHVMRSVYGPRLLVANPRGPEPWNWTAELVETISERRHFYSAFAGHFGHGIHSVFSRPTIYISCVRDPVGRFESFYSYVRKNKRHHHHEATRGKQIGEFFRYLRSTDDVELFNLQCLLICRRKEFRSAKKWIEANYFAVAPLTMIAPSTDYIARYLGWGKIDVPRLNEAERHGLAADMVESDLRDLEQGNSADRDLVRFCEDLMARKLARQDELFSAPLSAENHSSPITELRERLSRLQERIAAVTAERAEQATQIEELRLEIHRINADREARLKFIYEQQAQLEAGRRQVDAATAQIADLQATLHGVNADREARLKVILEQQQQIAELQASIAALNADREARLRVILEQQQQMADLQASIAVLNADREAQSKSISGERAKLAEAEQQVRTRDDRVKELASELYTVSQSRWARLGSALGLMNLRTRSTEE